MALFVRSPSFFFYFSSSFLFFFFSHHVLPVFADIRASSTRMSNVPPAHSPYITLMEEEESTSKPRGQGATTLPPTPAFKSTEKDSNKNDKSDTNEKNNELSIVSSSSSFYGLKIDVILPTPPSTSSSAAAGSIEKEKAQKCVWCEHDAVFEFKKRIYCTQHTFNFMAYEAMEIIVAASVRRWSWNSRPINPDPKTFFEMTNTLAAMVEATEKWGTHHRDLRTGSASAASLNSTFKIPDNVKLELGELWMPNITVKSKTVIETDNEDTLTGADERVLCYVNWQLNEWFAEQHPSVSPQIDISQILDTSLIF
jgi:hypothetical protein